MPAAEMTILRFCLCMFKWLVILGVFSTLFIQNRLLKKELELTESHQQRLVESHWKKETEEQLEILDELAEHFDKRPNRWPVFGKISSQFGFRPDPFTGYQAMHHGLDISAPHGTPVHAPASGKVIFAGDGGHLGLLITIQHDRNLITRYGHLSDCFVRPGEWVRRGEKIAAVGTTGRSTGPHLHYGVQKNGLHEDPLEYLE